MENIKELLDIERKEKQSLPNCSLGYFRFIELSGHKLGNLIHWTFWNENLQMFLPYYFDLDKDRGWHWDNVDNS